MVDDADSRLLSQPVTREEGLLTTPTASVVRFVSGMFVKGRDSRERTGDLIGVGDTASEMVGQSVSSRRGRENADPMSVNVSLLARTAINGATAGTCVSSGLRGRADSARRSSTMVLSSRISLSRSLLPTEGILLAWLDLFRFRRVLSPDDLED